MGEGGERGGGGQYYWPVLQYGLKAVDIFHDNLFLQVACKSVLYKILHLNQGIMKYVNWII